MGNFKGPLAFITPFFPREEVRPTLFIDRDDTLIADVSYMSDPSGVELLPGTVEGLKLFREAGYRLIVISNQSGIGRGLIRCDQLMAVQARLAELLAREGVTLDAVYCCPHAPEEICECRKPMAGMLLQAMKDFAIDKESSLMVGDRKGDVQAGIAAGVRSVQFLRFPDSEALPEAAYAVHRLPEAFARLQENGKV